MGSSWLLLLALVVGLFCVANGECEGGVEDGVVNATFGEECDDNNNDTTDACIECLDAVCGDNYTQEGV